MPIAAREQLNVLEGARDALADDHVGRIAEHALAFDQDVAAVGLIDARDAVEECRLASPVGTDQPDDALRPHLEGDIVQGDDAAESDADIPDREQRFGGSGGHGPAKYG